MLLDLGKDAEGMPMPRLVTLGGLTSERGLTLNGRKAEVCAVLDNGRLGLRIFSDQTGSKVCIPAEDASAKQENCIPADPHCPVYIKYLEKICHTLMFKQQRFSESIPHFRSLASLRPDHQTVQMLAVALRETGQCPEAVRLMTRVVA